MNPDIQQLQNRVTELENFIQSLKFSYSIPLEIDQAFRTRFAATNSNPILSGKSATSQNQTVNEGGVAVYAVLGVPVGYLQVTISGTIYYLPYYS